MSEHKMNIYQKLAKVREHVEVLRKNREGHNYTYVDAETILASITGTMKDLGISLIPRILPGTTHVDPCPYTTIKFTKDGKQYEDRKNEVIVRADMEYHWVNDEDPDERVIIPWTLLGQQTNASQAFGSGLTYCGRYFLLEYFNIATTQDDPDNWRSLQQEAMEKESREMAKRISETSVRIINEQLERDTSKRPAVLDIVKRFAKDKNGKSSTNPLTINDPAVAAALLDEVRKFFGVEDEQRAS